MAKLRHKDRRLIEEVLEMSEGYCLDFSNTTFSEFFEDELNINIDDRKYFERGESKAKRVRTFIDIEPPIIVSKMLHAMLTHKVDSSSGRPLFASEEKLIGVIKSLEEDAGNDATATLLNQTDQLNLDTVQRDINRALSSARDDPESAITSACATVESVCRTIILDMGSALPKKKDLAGLYGVVKEQLGLAPNANRSPDAIADDVLRILGGLNTVVQGIGALRTHSGDAHGREKGYRRVDYRIAKLAIHGASTLAVFLVETWQIRRGEDA